jgi:hypothetical protein
VVTDLVSLLAFLASGAASAGIAKLLEQMAWFQSLKSNGKLITVFSASAVIALVAVYLQSLVSSAPFINATIDPYLKAVLPLINLLITQIVHGNDTVASGVRIGRSIRGE